MGIENQIKALLKEAEVYRSQGLFDEAREKYNSVAELIQKNEQLKNRQRLLDGVSKKISTLESQLDRDEKVLRSYKMSTKEEQLVKSLFSQPRKKGVSELEGAIALATLGQFEKALVEFNKLMNKASLRVVVAKNILRCHIGRSALDDAVAQYEQWLSSGFFSSAQLENIRTFLQGILKKKGMEKTLPAPKEPAAKKPADVKGDETPEAECLDVSLIGITLDSGPRKGELIELDVNFQKGNIVSVLIPSGNADVIDSLEVGLRLNEVECSSAFAVFRSAATVSEKTRIESGPRQGDYMVDIKIEGT